MSVAPTAAKNATCGILLAFMHANQLKTVTLSVCQTIGTVLDAKLLEPGT